MSLKEVLRAVREDAVALLADCGLEEDDVAKSERAMLLFAATAALKRLEAGFGEGEDVSAAAKAARKQLKPHLAEHISICAERRASAGKRRREGSSSSSSEDQARAPPRSGEERSAPPLASSSSLSLGQYASAGAFKGDASKQAKFARLMGGGRGDAKGGERNTHAADDTTISRINRDLENQYESALTRKGKKGLGA